MKILFLTSGYDGIYEHFEAWILNELRKRHEVSFFQVNNGFSIFQSHLRSFNPDIAFTLVGFKIPILMLNWLKTSQVKTAVWFTEDPYYMDQTSILAGYFDFIFTIDSAALEYYQVNGHKHVYQLLLATEPEIFKPKEIHELFISDICIVGYPYPDRINLVQFLLENTNLNIKVVGKWRKALNYVQRNPQLTIHEGWVEPTVVSDFYNGASIVLNTHRPFNLKQNQNRPGIVGKSINNRTFDAAACASFQLIEFKEDLPNHFNEGEEIVSYKNEQELIEKIHYFILNTDERKRIADNAMRRVLTDHTFENRIEKMLDIISTTSL